MTTLKFQFQREPLKSNKTVFAAHRNASKRMMNTLDWVPHTGSWKQAIHSPETHKHTIRQQLRISPRPHILGFHSIKASHPAYTTPPIWCCGKDILAHHWVSQRPSSWTRACGQTSFANTEKQVTQKTEHKARKAMTKIGMEIAGRFSYNLSEVSLLSLSDFARSQKKMVWPFPF